MTKKDYEIIAGRIHGKHKQAKVLAEYHATVGEPKTSASWDRARSSIVELAYDLCIDFYMDNSRFDKDRFIAACGITEEEL